MTTIFELKPGCPPAPPYDQAEADKDRRAECMERISGLLSALGGGACMPPGKIDEPPKTVVRETMPNPGSETSVAFLLMDRTGPIAEFKSWDDARRYMTSLQINGASIVRVKKKPPESEEATD